MLSIVELCLSHGHGGLELYVVKLARKLDKMEEVSVHTITRAGTFADQQLADLNNTSISRRSPFKLLAAARTVAKTLERVDAAILHINWGHDLALAVLAKRLCRKPVKLMYSRHMHITRRKHDFYHRFLYRHVDLLLVTTEKMQSEAEACIPMHPRAMTLLSLGVAPAPADQRQPRSSLGLEDHVFTIGNFSRIEYDKGQHVLLDALRLLDSEGAQFQAAFIGYAMDQQYRDELKSKAGDWGLADRITFREFLPEAIRYMPCFDVIVVTSYSETFGLVLVEAMSMGVGVIGTNSGGVPETITHEETGMLFEPGDARQLADALLRLYRDKDLRQGQARAGQAFVEQRFSEDKHYARLLDIFREQASLLR